MATSPGLALQPFYVPYALASVVKPEAARAGMAYSQNQTASKRNTLAEFSALLAEVLQGVDQPARSPVETARRGPRSASSQFRGVTKHRRTKRWESHIWHQRQQRYLGGFSSEWHAGKAHDVMALKCRGCHGPLNFPLGTYSRLLPLLDKVSQDEVVLALRQQNKGGRSVCLKPPESHTSIPPAESAPAVLMGSSVERSPEDHLSQTPHSHSHSQGSLMDQTGSPHWTEAHSGLSYSINASEGQAPLSFHASEPSFLVSEMSMPLPLDWTAKPRFDSRLPAFRSSFAGNKISPPIGAIALGSSLAQPPALCLGGPSAFPVSDGSLQLQSPTSAFTQPAPYLGHAWLYREDSNPVPKILLGRPLHKPPTCTNTSPHGPGHAPQLPLPQCQSESTRLPMTFNFGEDHKTHEPHACFEPPGGGSLPGQCLSSEGRQSLASQSAYAKEE